MRFQALLLTAALGLGGCFGAPAPQPEGVVDLQQTMKAMGREWKAISQSDDPAIIANHLAQIHQLSSDASRAMVRKGEQADYEDSMVKFQVALETVQGTIAAGEFDDLEPLLADLDALRKEYHKRFKP
ncbi:cytochrome b562 [Ferrimonas balearica]|uniref:cytochrome b562 n=1 Tax=Ferrimonas balearica TaxID=44012 RepID=UPI001F186C3C|nr:cytochrome b562 [Ferrimonas balearica]MBY6095371.1 hypothetical protein [Ferrimonas balearica]